VSTDPILNEYMRGAPNGGVRHPENLGPYTYVWNNSVGRRDPDGKAVGEDTLAGCLIGGHIGCGVGFAADVATALLAGAALGFLGHEILHPPQSPPVIAPAPAPASGRAGAEHDSTGYANSSGRSPSDLSRGDSITAD